MDNPTRSADYIARCNARRLGLQQTLVELLASHSRITLEIGAGHGHFLTDYATAHPTEFCVGIDLLHERVERALRKRNRAKLANLAFLQAAADEFISVLPAPTTIQRIFVLFPDPWPKRRHHKNRIMQPDFLHSLATRSEVGADLCFRTDDTSYFSTAKAVVQVHPDWQVSPAPWPFERETVFQSRASVYQSLVATRQAITSKL